MSTVRGPEAKPRVLDRSRRAMGLDSLAQPFQRRRRLTGRPDGAEAAEEERALDQALQHPRLHQGLRFLHEWPDHRRAARLVVTRRSELDGVSYGLLGPVAEALAASLCLRAMVDFTLERARSTRYRHAARHLDTCRPLAASGRTMAASTGSGAW